MSAKYRLQAARELWQRYTAIFGHFWKIRRELSGGLFRPQEAEFMPAALAIQEKPVSKSVLLTSRLILAMVVFIFVWACIGKMDIVVNATGKVIASDYTKSIASVEVAAVRALYVHEGQSVKAGDVLLELDSSSADAEDSKASGITMEARLQVARSQALIDAIDTLQPPKLSRPAGVSDAQWLAAPGQLSSQYRDFRSKVDRLDGEIARYRSTLPLAAQRASDYLLLSKTQDVSHHAWLEKEQARADLEGQLTDARHQRAALVSQTRKEAWDALTEGRKAAAANLQDAQRAQEHSKLLKLLAPVDGTVQQLTVHTVGGVVPAAQPLMLIVPAQHQLEIEAFIENKDVGFVRVGQRAAVKIDAFDYTKYGTLQAKVTHVSRDAIQDEKKGLLYSTKVLLDQTSLSGDGKLPVSVGMSVNVEMKTGERRVIEYFLSPLLQYKRESLSER